MRKILLTKKLKDSNAKLFDGIPDIDLVTVGDDEKDKFDLNIKDSECLLLSTAYQMTKDVIDNAEKLKIISRTGVGVDNVDVKAATDRKVLVLNTPEANSISVAEHTVALIISISKQLLMYDSELRAGNFAIRRTNRSVDIDGKVLGLIGCGRIGRFTAEKCEAAFNMQVIGYDPYIKELAGITLYETIEEVFKKADYISLHIPLTDETKNMVGARLISLMKPTAYIINTARGGIIDEAALADALKENRIAGAALDVLESEPPKADNPLMPLRNVILTPHSAALTKECSARVEHEAVLGISDYLKGNTPKFVFNRELIK
jgi:D-3-phosphoglycerate dehydrogenase / 2-oxoglutarate reductase